MNTENKNTALDILVEALAAMTLRALEAERRLNSAQEDSDRWYQAYKREKEKLDALGAEYAAEIEAHNQTRDALENAVELLNGEVEA